MDMSTPTAEAQLVQSFAHAEIEFDRAWSNPDHTQIELQLSMSTACCTSTTGSRVR